MCVIETKIYNTASGKEEHKVHHLCKEAIGDELCPNVSQKTTAAGIMQRRNSKSTSSSSKSKSKSVDLGRTSSRRDGKRPVIDQAGPSRYVTESRSPVESSASSSVPHRTRYPAAPSPPRPAPQYTLPTGVRCPRTDCPLMSGGLGSDNGYVPPLPHDHLVRDKEQPRLTGDSRPPSLPPIGADEEAVYSGSGSGSERRRVSVNVPDQGTYERRTPTIGPVPASRLRRTSQRIDTSSSNHKRHDSAWSPYPTEEELAQERRSRREEDYISAQEAAARRTAADDAARQERRHADDERRQYAYERWEDRRHPPILETRRPPARRNSMSGPTPRQAETARAEDNAHREALRVERSERRQRSNTNREVESRNAAADRRFQSEVRQGQVERQNTELRQANQNALMRRSSNAVEWRPRPLPREAPIVHQDAQYQDQYARGLDLIAQDRAYYSGEASPESSRRRGSFNDDHGQLYRPLDSRTDRMRRYRDDHGYSGR